MDASLSTFSEGPEDPFAARRAASVVLDPRGRVVGWSERAEELLGYTAEEVLGRSAIDVLMDSPEDRGFVLAAVAACLREQGWFGIVPLRHREGHRVEMGCRARVVLRPDATYEWYIVGAPAQEVLQWETDRSVLDGLFRRSPIGLAIYAPDLRILRVNRAIANFSGVPAEYHRGLRVADFLFRADAEAVEAQLRQVLESGKSSIFAEQPVRILAVPQQELVASASAFRMQDSSGRVLGVAQTVEDVTDRVQARRRLALLNEASARIGTTLDVATTARELAEVAVPDLADYVTVDLLEPVNRGEEPDQGTYGEMRRMATRGISPDALRVMYPVGDVINFPPEAPYSRCLVEHRPVLETFQDSRLPWLADDPERAERAFGLGLHSLMVVPLAARGLVLGTIGLWRSRRPEPFEEDDLTLAEEFASRAALCIDNARRYTQQHQAALTLQHSLLPAEVPGHPAAEVAHRYRPADPAAGVGGDWFDVIPLSGLRVALVVGDVVGHGTHAAVTMGRLRTAVHTLANLDLAPDEILAHLDALVDRLAVEQEATGTPSPQLIGATCLYAVYDPVSRRCTMARANHLPPVMVTPDGQVSIPDVPAGPPLGLGGLPFESAELELAEGSLLALYTDGLVESRRQDLDDGLARLRAALTAPARTLEETCTAVEEAMLPEHPADDVALLIARTRALAAEKVATWELPTEPTIAAEARKLATRQLAEWQLDEMAVTTELIVSELATNAYRYANGPITLRLIRHRDLICEVSDRSSTAPHLRQARTTDEGGRGLFLVAQLAQRWGTRYVRDGKTIWAEQPLRMADPKRSMG
ncbi:SpoIIE family protein phosphatase [Streptomyces halobius]|uniref:PAS domain-containing SpoIIE family protein phosphatase/ATP-binding protein n=1 Tax=Streptomyces halobius TaxID=2879846 RepID=A0ABY4LZH7_9ACTN|nr:SpoIIE family protein phosphatase [Streptomyces halobius]UQA90904.1 PAS domain-containing SpoIIE family protein phosphatase/ATP-binding protein [Streptomyces halobius]